MILNDRHRRTGLAAGVCMLLSTVGCGSGDGGDAAKLRAVELERSNALACLSAPAEVIYTEANEPHIYADNDTDAACALGFVAARDRFFEMEMAARLALGEISGLFGEFGLATDIENRTIGMRAATERMLAGASPTWRTRMEAYAAGVNAYIERARAGVLPPPSEFEFGLLQGLGGFDNAADMLDDWDLLKVAAVGTVVVYEAGFGTSELGRERGLREAETWGVDLPQSALRRAGLVTDIVPDVAPLFPINSSPEFDAATTPPTPTAAAAAPPAIEANTLARAIQRGEAWQRRHKHPADKPGIGSNGWAVGPELTADGQTLLAGDGHLSLTVPSFFYLAHLNTTVLGDGTLNFLGLSLPGVPLMGPGTNGRIAWTQTVLNGDMLDWYAEEVVLDAAGKPAALRFQGAEQPLDIVRETYPMPDGGEREIARYRTQAGRLLYSLEGTVVTDPAPDSPAVNVGGEWVIAGDTDGDGTISAVSMVFGSQFERHLFDNIGAFAEADNIDEIAAHFRNVVNYSAILTVADAEGGIMTNGFVAAPCRTFLPRDADGVPVPGANPQRLIDGTRYPSWEVRIRDDGTIDPAPNDERACTIPFEAYPIGRNPGQGYLLNANNEIHDNSFDNNLWNDTYLGGPWAIGFRAERIDAQIRAGAGTHDVDSMAALQADHRSNTAALLLADFLAAIERVAALPATAQGSAARQRAQYMAAQDRIEDARTRLSAWRDRGLDAASGVATFYNQPTDDARDDAVATSIWNAWLIQAVNGLFDDENIPGGAFAGSSRSRQLKLLRDFLDGVGPNNPGDLASWNPETREPIFWDDATTPELEQRDEILVHSLVRGLDFLAGAPGPELRSGGFGSADPDDWRWGLKHFVRFESILSLAVGNEFQAVFEQFGITTDDLPLGDMAPALAGRLKGFPRPGDMFNVDAGNFGFDEDFSYSSGPVMRMVLSIGPDGVSGKNILPGGQSGLNDSPHFADQAARWLGNQALPVRFSLDDVVAGAQAREQLTPVAGEE